jgi:AAA ATPase domain/Bacterial regulatory protein, Fis family
MGGQPAEAERIRQALAQTGGNVSGAARLLGMSRDMVRYRMQRFGIARPHPRTSSPLASTTSPVMEDGESHPQGDGLPPEPQVALTETPMRGPKYPRGAATCREAGGNAATDRDAATPPPVWAQKPVAVLALEVTWPQADGPEPSRYNAWTEMARWEASIMERAHGFGGVLVQRTASLLTWVFGLPQVVEQLPQRAVHVALSVRQMVAEARTPILSPAPEVRLAEHLGAVRVDTQAPDLVAHMLVVGETLALPVRLLGQAAAGEILVSPEVGRLVEGWVNLQARPLRLRAGDSARTGGYAVVGVSPGRVPLQPGGNRPHSLLVGRERELALLEAVWAQVKAGRGQVVSVVGAPGMGKSRLLSEFRQRLTGQRVRFAEGQCLAYGTSIPYLPVLDLVCAYCGVMVNAPPERLVTMVRNSLRQAHLDPDASLPYLVHVLGVPVNAEQLSGVSAEARRIRAFEIFRQLFLGASRQQPILLAVENLHWIDPTSEALLTSLVEALAERRSCSWRPSVRGIPRAGWISRTPLKSPSIR